MEVHYYKEHSRNLNRDMEFKTYGTGGKVCLAFPSQNGHFYDFENFHMTDTVARWIDAGRLFLVCPDSIDEETWSDEGGDPRRRIERHEAWYHYITDELLPRVRTLAHAGADDKALVTGCSMGGVHAGTFFFRRPDLFDAVIALSGLYNASYFFHDYSDELVYANSPVAFLKNMPADHPYMALYRRSKMYFCVGQGAWEDDLLYGTRELDTILCQKGIPAVFDYWGYDVHHDWCWWQKQLPYFMEKVLGA